MTINDYIPQAEYLQVLRLVPIVCVDVAIVRDNKVLLVKRKDKPAQGQWWFPGGRVYKGENLKQAALRKALEEVGLDCIINKIVDIAQTVFNDGPEGIPVHSVNTIFELHVIDNGKVSLDDKHTEYIWADADWFRENNGKLHQYMINGVKKICLEPKLIENPYYKVNGSLFWIRQPEGKKIYLPGIQMDLIWRHGDTKVTIQGALPENANLFNFRDGDALCLLYKDYGAPDEFIEDQIMLTIAGCQILQFEAKRLVDSQSDEAMSFELVVQGKTVENKFVND